MKTADKHSPIDEALRKRAEEQVCGDVTVMVAPPEADMQTLLHELQVHQIELELQNEELLLAQAEVKAGLEQYRELYDYAPAGYFSFDHDGSIRKVNLTLLIERSRLIDRRFQLFLSNETRGSFTAFLERVFQTTTRQACEVALHLEGDQPVFVRIEAEASEGCQLCLAAVTDITERTQLAEKLQKAHDKLEVTVQERTRELTCANMQLLLEIEERTRVEDELRKSTRRITIMDRISTIFLTASDEEVYGEVLDVVLEVMESRFGIFGFIADNGDLLIPSMTREVWEACRIPDKTIVFPPDAWGKSLWGRAIREKTTFYANEILHTPEGHIQIDNCLAVPIIFGDKAIGLLSVANKDGGYSEEDKKLQEVIASRISPILEARQQKAHKEQELRLAMDYNRNLIEASLDPLVTISPDGKVTDVNAATEKATGYSREELIGTDFSAYFTEPEKARNGYQQAFRDGEMRDYPLQIVHRDGHEASVLYNAAVFLDENGECKGVFAAARDITELQRTEQALKLSEDRLTKAQRLARIGCWELDLVTNNLIWSDEIYRIFEINPEQFSASYEAFLELIHPDDRATVNAAYTGSVVSHIPYVIGHRLRFPDGRIKNVMEQCETFYAADGRPLRSIGTIQDITELKQAEEKLRSSETSLRTLVQTIPDLIWLKDTAGRYLICNRMFERFFGARETDILGKTDYDFVDRELADSFHEHDLKAMAAGKLSSNEEWVTFADDGHRALLETIKTPMADDAGNLIGVLGIGHDITEHRSLEKQLRQAQKMEAIGQLAGGVAHDFNNILSVIIGYSALMEMKMDKDNPLKENVNQILVAADRAAKLTGSLLAFSRKQIMNLQTVNLSQLIMNIEKFLHRIIGEDIVIKTIFHQNELTVHADAGQIEQVLMNLAVNARDAMPQGGMLSIEVGSVVLGADFIKNIGYGEPGEYALLSITDTGTGMDEITSKKLFEPFFTTKELGRGTGLGLSIVYGIVKQHNGYINVQSELGAGTTFSIYLPLAGACINTGSPCPDEHLKGGTETVLIADDDAAVLEIAEIILGNYGYTVITAKDGLEAVNKFRENRERIALVILDVLMPKMNGKEAFDEIRKICPGMKELFISGYTADIIHSRGMLDESLFYLAKPLRPLEFIKKVREVLDRSS